MSEPAPDARGTRGPAPTTIGLGVLAVLVVLVLLADLPPAATLPIVALLVVALGVVGFLAARRPRSDRAPLAGLGLVGAVLWFWGVVTGAVHLLGSVLDDPDPVVSIVTGLVTTAIWAASTWFLRRPAAR